MHRLFLISAAAAAVCLAQKPPEDSVVTVRTGAAMAAPGANVFYFSQSMGDAGPPVKNSPYSADVIDEHVQTLGDGNRIRTVNNGKVYRDSEGRTRRDETMALVGPWSTAGQKEMHAIISDPVAGTAYDLDERQKTVHKLPVLRSDIAAPGGGIGLSMAPHDVVRLKAKLSENPGNGSAKTEDLGTRVIEGVPCQGTRVTITIPEGAMGNERPIETVTERWTSPDLQTPVLITIHDPRMGDSTHKLQNIIRGEPSAAVFEVPADYKVVEGPATLTLPPPPAGAIAPTRNN